MYDIIPSTIFKQYHPKCIQFGPYITSTLLCTLSKHRFSMHTNVDLFTIEKYLPHKNYSYRIMYMHLKTKDYSFAFAIYISCKPIFFHIK